MQSRVLHQMLVIILITHCHVFMIKIVRNQFLLVFPARIRFFMIH